ncbi:MAG: hypothetical protein ACRDHS_12120, partial [Actinomycetota bacterium]
MTTKVTVEGDDNQLLATPAARARRRPRIVRRVIIVTGAALLVPFLFLLGSRLGKDPTLVRSPLLG